MSGGLGPEDGGEPDGGDTPEPGTEPEPKDEPSGETDPLPDFDANSEEVSRAYDERYGASTVSA